MVPSRVMKMVEFESTHVDVFPTRVVGYNLNDVVDSEYITDVLWDIASMSSVAPHGLLPGGVSSYDESPNKRVLADHRLTTLRDILTEHANTYCSTVGFPKVEIVQNWYNISAEGTSLKEHSHRFAICVCAYYPSKPKNSSNLFFSSDGMKNHREHHQEMVEAEINNFANLKPTPYNQVDYELSVQEGWVYFFPGYLKHWAPANNSSERIVVSCNFNSVGNMIPYSPK